MSDQDSLRNLILTHWQNHQPAMLAQFQQENRLETELEATAERFSDMLYSLVVEQKMSYPSAWEMIIAELLQSEPEEESE